MRADLLDELSTDRADAADKEVKHFIFGEEEGVVEHVHGLAKLSALNDKRDVGLRGSLCTGDDGDTTSSECAEELSGNTSRMLHVFAHDSHCSEVALHVHGIHGTILDLLQQTRCRARVQLQRRPHRVRR